MKRHVSKEYARQLWLETHSVTEVARKIGYSWKGTLRMLRRFGIRRK